MSDTHSASLDRLQLAVAALVAAATTMLLQLALLITIDVRATDHGTPLRDVLTKWDAQWMMNIADHGYFGPPIDQSVAFFPGYPVLVRAVGAPLAIFGAPDATLVTAIGASVLTSLAASAGLAVLALDIWTRLGLPITLATLIAVPMAAAVAFSGAPMSVIYWMPYSESLFTALATWSLVAMIRRRFLTAGVLVLLAGVTRLTGAALVATLAVAALIELISWYRRRHEDDRRFPWRAAVAPMISGAGLAAYLTWASIRTVDVGGYFAVQDRGWNSAFDGGRATLTWLRDTLVEGFGDPVSTGYTISSWAMVAVAALVLVSLWPLIRGWLPWQMWKTGGVLVGIVLGSDGVMHSRPRLLLMATALLVLPFAVRAVHAAASARGWRRWASSAVLLIAAVGWCAAGFWVSTTMLVDFKYGI
ncbi:mannosyltransferase family protein [Gordonia neofelifaecis]|uniref:Integral membrane protein n=1 Tax=Gordonia neofelifaecis NRRL B-59395 TaxID=644548 RepID=F1YE48_9ACTN|nr:mannosyltransferase family protein [Gordonia neofelifaecis]EGD57138.1 integral membrane protein [Gordonia neofelifaecis NRRL B-59395]